MSRLPRRTWVALLVIAFLGFTANLRTPITVIPPLLPSVAKDLGMSAVAQGALTSVPVLCFGLLTPIASRVVARLGANTGAVCALALAIIGAILRVLSGTAMAFVGTVVIGAGITIGNIVAPMIIGRDFWNRTSTLTGLYSAAMNVAVAASTALAVPVALLVTWRGSSALWSAVPAALALALWLWIFPMGAKGPRASIQERAGRRAWVAEKPSDVEAPVPTAVWKRPLVWVMAISFAAHVFCYYGVSAWLPTALADLAHLSESGAGVASSLFSVTGIVGPLLVPIMFGAMRWTGRRVLAVLSACWIVLPIGLIALPRLWLVWCLIAGIAQGAYFAALFTIVIRRAETIDENRQMSAFIQAVGYIVASTGAVVMGWAHTASGGWTAPFGIVLAVLVVMTVTGQIAARTPRKDAARKPRLPGPEQAV